VNDLQAAGLALDLLLALGTLAGTACSQYAWSAPAPAKAGVHLRPYTNRPKT
jgi:hypothetical protein